MHVSVLKPAFIAVPDSPFVSKALVLGNLGLVPRSRHERGHEVAIILKINLRVFLVCTHVNR